MSDQDAPFLQAILQDPDDDALRLVYADFLEERGDPRSEFIRLQIELDQISYRDPRKPALERRQEELLATHRQEWTRHLQPFDETRVVAMQFQRGFIDGLTIREGSDGDCEILLRTSGLRRLVIQSSTLNESGLRFISGLTFLDALTLEETPVDAAGLSILEALPCWTVVRIHHEGGTPAVDDGTWQDFQERRVGKVAQLDERERRRAAARFLRHLDGGRHSRGPRITRASLVQAYVSDAELRLLGGLPELEEVHISESWHVTTVGLRHLAALPNLKYLKLYDTAIDSIAPLSGCSRLETLEISRSGLRGVEGGMGDEGMVGLEALTNLRKLALTDPAITDETFRRVGLLRKLRELELHFVRFVPDEDSDGLAELTGLAQLERLSIYGYYDVNDEGLRHLTPMRNLQSLTISLDGSGCGLRHLAGLRELRHLVLSGEAVNDAGIQHLASLTRLRTLFDQDERNGVSVEAATALAAQLPEVTIILKEHVVKSPRRVMTFQRRQLEGYVSALFPCGWSDRGFPGEWCIDVIEDGWGRLRSHHAGVGPASMRLSLEHAGSESADVELLEIVENNAHQGPRILEEGVASIAGARDTASCVFRNSFEQCLASTAVVDGRVISLTCRVKPNRFEEFRPLFCYVARSIRLGDTAMIDVGAESEVPTSELR